MKAYNYDSFGQCEDGAPDFRSVAKIGSEAPDFTLTDLDGKQVRCRHSGRRSLCLWNSAASPDRRLWGRFPPLTELYRGYRDQGFQFFIIYSREAHPGENYPHHESFEQKMTHARKLRELDIIDDIPILLDDIQGTAHLAYGLLPNMVYLIARDARWFTSPTGQMLTRSTACARACFDWIR